MSFFNNGRQVFHFWGRTDGAVAFRGWTVAAYMQQLARAENAFQIDYFPTSITINTAGKPARAVLWGQVQSNLGEVKKFSADVIMPCDKQMPWKKLHYGFLHVVGLTISGELYVKANFRDVYSGTFVRRWRTRKDYNDLYAAFLYSSFSRFFSPDAPLAFKDFSLAWGNTNTYSDTSLLNAFKVWSCITLISADSRVFVVGTGMMGEHGIPPTQQKPNATIESFFDIGERFLDSTQTFWQSTIPPYFPVATEVSLPSGVVAAAVPQETLGSVVGEDGQLYAWWCDPSNGTMYQPRKMTGFLKSMRVTDRGSVIETLDREASGFPDGNEVRRGVWLDFDPPPPGGQKPVAFAVLTYTDQYRLNGDVHIINPGLGYTTPPQAWLNGLVWKGAPAQFSCEIFGDSDSFALPLKAQSPWLIGSDGCVYHYRQPFVIMRPFRYVGSNHNGAQFQMYAVFRWLAPMRATMPGVRFKYASKSCFISEDGGFYVVFPRGEPRSSSIPFDAESSVLDYLSYTFTTAAYNSYGTSFGTGGSPSGDPTPYALFKIGSGFESGASNVPLGSVSEGYSRYAAAGIKEDGTMWTAGSNFRGMLGDNENLFTSRRTFQQISEGTEWVSVESDSGSDANIFYAVRKDAVCRSRTQPMEYASNPNYYSNPPAIR